MVFGDKSRKKLYITGVSLNLLLATCAEKNHEHGRRTHQRHQTGLSTVGRDYIIETPRLFGLCEKIFRSCEKMVFQQLNEVVNTFQEESGSKE
jgi:hypothetical protein